MLEAHPANRKQCWHRVGCHELIRARGAEDQGFTFALIHSDLPAFFGPIVIGEWRSSDRLGGLRSSHHQRERALPATRPGMRPARAHRRQCSATCPTQVIATRRPRRESRETTPRPPFLRRGWQSHRRCRRCNAGENSDPQIGSGLSRPTHRRRSSLPRFRACAGCPDA